MDELTTLVESSDLAGLIRLVEREIGAGAWEVIVDVAERCREAVGRGKQLWAVAEYAEYRLALDGPGAYAGAVVGDGRAGFALGPLWEVAASTHTWDELAPHLGAPLGRALAAHERVLRGDRVDAGDLAIDPIEVPFHLAEWEPSYPLAVYRGDGADFPEAERPALEWADLPEAPDPIDGDAASEAMLDLVRPWWDESSGRAVVTAVEGPALSAVRALGPRRARVGRISLQQALAAMAWAGASGGAYGRRRGTPVGRAGAWWVLAELLQYPEVPDSPDWGAEGAELEWWLWDPGDLTGGWALHLAVHDPDSGTSRALSAVDMR